jgi:predicted MFS family arabinose efflux permease
MVLWGISYIIQSTLIPAVVAKIIAVDMRAAAYGTLFGLFGLSRFVGSAVMGYLYDSHPAYLVLFSLIVQCAALTPFFILTPTQE